MQYRNKDFGFQMVEITNPPASFGNVSGDEDKTYGYLVDLSMIGAYGAKFGTEYQSLIGSTDEKVTFGTTDVYVYDSSGTVYYAKGMKVEQDETPIYKVENNNNVD